MPKKDLVLKIDPQWRVKLIGVDEVDGSVDDVIIDREDCKFFSIIITKALGYIFPMFFEKTNAKDICGTICLIVRTSPGGKKFIVVEKKKAINFKGEVENRSRACRSSISSPDGSPIPIGSKKPSVHRLGIIELNDMRIAGPVEGIVVEQDWDEDLKPGQELMAFSEFSKSHDAPGKAVLFSYMYL